MNADNRNYQVDRSWILCPSKSFPGKFYYFNVLNGEAAWSLSDIEKKTFTKNYVHRVTDKYHGYPEPDSPPSEDGPNLYNSHNMFRRPDYPAMAVPAFAQPAFPKFAMGQPPHLDPYQSSNTMSSWWSQMPLSQPIRTPPDLKRPFDMPPCDYDRNMFRSNNRDIRYNTNYEPQRLHENPFINVKQEATTPLKRWNFESQAFPFAQKPQVATRLFEQKVSKPLFEPHQNYWNMVQKRQAVDNTCPPKLVRQSFDKREPVFRRHRSLSESSISEDNINLSRHLPLSNQNNCNNCMTPQKSLQDTSKMSCTNHVQNSKIDRAFTALNLFTKPNDSLKANFQNPFQSPYKFNKPNAGRFDVDAKDYMISKSAFKNLKIKVTSDKRIAVADDKKENGFFDHSVINNNIFQKTNISEQKINIDSDQILNARKRFSGEQIFSIDHESVKRPKTAEMEQVKNSSVRKKITFSSEVFNEKPLIDVPKDVEALSCNTNSQKGTEFSSNSLLTKEDLRYKLLIKKTCKTNDTAEKPNVSNQKDTERNNKKKVTFNLGVEDFSDDSDVPAEVQEFAANDNNKTNRVLTVSMLRDLANAPSKSEKWFIAVDTKVLLEDLEFMEDYVQSDTTCTLLIPLAVQMCIESLSQGEGGGRVQVNRARSVARAIAHPPQYCLLQSVEEDNSPDTTVEDSILKCCLQYMKEGYHVVLITNSEDLYKKAYSQDVFCFSIEDIKAGAGSLKPEITFDIQKQSNFNKMLGNDIKTNIVQKSSMFSNTATFQGCTNANTFALGKEKISINVARKGLLGTKNCGNIDNHCLFSKNNDVSNTENHLILQKNSSNSKMFSNGGDFNGNFCLAPKNLNGPYRGVAECESESTVEELNQKLKRFTIDDHLNENQQKDFNQPSNVHVSLSKEEKTKRYKAKLERIKNINSYTLDEYLKKFLARNKPSEEIIKPRVEEFVCSFTQILEETLSDLLQANSVQTITSPPWELSEAIEGIKQLLEDNNSIRIITEKLALLIHGCSCRDGKLKPNTNEFLRILGCGMILIKCLKAHLPAACCLREAEGALQVLVTHMSSPPSAPSPHPLPTPHTDTPDHVATNFVKKPSEVLRYLQKHFPDWQGHKEDEAEMENSKIIRTSGKQINTLKIDNSKTISMGNPNYNNNDTINTKVLVDKIQHIDENSNIKQMDTKAPSKPETVKETGAKLLKKLALNTNIKKRNHENVNLDKMEIINKHMTSMIDDIFSGRVPESPNKNSNPNFDRNHNMVNVSQKQTVFNGHEYVKTQNGVEFAKRSITRKIKDTDLRETVKDGDKDRDLNLALNIEQNKGRISRKIDFSKLSSPRKDNNISSDDQSANNGGFNNKNVESTDKFPVKPKIVKPIKDMEEYLKKLKKNFINFEALEYSDKNTDDESQKLVINEDYNHNIDDNVLNGIEDQRSNNAMEADTTNDSGIEVEGSHAYSLVKAFLIELSASFKAVYQFVDQVIQTYRNKHMSEGQRRQLHERASQTYDYLLKIIVNLKRIMSRESQHSTLLQLLSKADEEAMSDVRITKYSRVVTKCVEQGQLLSNALKMVFNLTDENCDISFIPDDINIKYYNIFE